MKTTYNWLKDFVEIRLPAPALAEKLTMAGLEVTSLEPRGKDWILELEVTSNRPDCLCVMGIAREIAAITARTLRRPSASRGFAANLRDILTDSISISIKDKKACPFYSGRIIRAVKVGPSPGWLAARLEMVGLRPINNIVDVTNYVLFVSGQPLHAFDLNKLSAAKIVIRFAAPQEEITTIDGTKRRLTPDILVIADEQKPQAIAGIMGGWESQVTGSTVDILLESAFFSPQVVRRGSRILGLSSESSYRFERSVNLANVVVASDLASSMIVRFASGRPARLAKAGLVYSPKRIISFHSKACSLLGEDIPFAKISSILKSLEFKVASGQKKDILKVTPPAFRQDVSNEADLWEEVGRIYGYGEIASSLPAIRPPAIKEDIALRIQEDIRQVLTAGGFSQVITYSLLSPEDLKRCNLVLDSTLYLENPLSAEQEVLRPDLSSGLLKTMSRNLELGNGPCRFFENGSCFSQKGETKLLGLISNDTDFLGLKGQLELLLARIGIRECRFVPSSLSLFEKGYSCDLVAEAAVIGSLGKVEKGLLADFKIDSLDVFIAQINLDKIGPYIDFTPEFKTLPKYPSLMRDLSLLVSDEISCQRILDTVSACNIQNLQAVSFKDLYRSPAIGPGKKSVTVSLEFRSPRATLTDVEVEGYMKDIIERATRDLGAAVRG